MRRRIPVRQGPFYCVLQVRDYRLKYLGNDRQAADEAAAVNGCHLVEAWSAGDAQRQATIEAARLQRLSPMVDPTTPYLEGPPLLTMNRAALSGR